MVAVCQQLLTELEILGAGFLQRGRAHGVTKLPQTIFPRPNRNAVESFSPALDDAVGLRWVGWELENNPERVAADGKMNREIHQIREKGKSVLKLFAYFAWFAVQWMTRFLMQPLQG